MSQLTDQCIEILQKTNDGDDLDPNHLKLVETQLVLLLHLDF